MATPQIDLDFVRRHFPAFDEPTLRNLAYFENAGGSHTCRYVLWRLNRFFRERHVAPDQPYRAAQLGAEEVEEARIRLAQMLGVLTDEVCFGSSTTQNVYVLAQAFAQWLAPGDAIVVSDQNHEANSGPWRRLGEHGVEVRRWRMDEDGRLTPDGLSRVLDDRVRLVCFPHVSNLMGEINDAAAITRLVHKAGGAVCINGGGYVPHAIPNIAAIGADIYLFSARKAYGPGQGVMVVRGHIAAELPHQCHDHEAHIPYRRLVAGGQDHSQIAACAGIADYVDAIYKHHFTAGRDAKGRAAEVSRLMRQQETSLMAPLLGWLAGNPRIRLLGPSTIRGRTPTITVVPRRPAREVAAALAERGVMAASGHFHAPQALQALGVHREDGVLRLSFLHYTSRDEIDHLVDALEACV